MKKVTLFFALALLMSYGAISQNLAIKEAYLLSKNETNRSFFMWEKSVHDFGSIEKGTPVSAVFKFQNSGSLPISISNVTTSCGCTVADYSKEKIMPGEWGYIKATYNAAREGAFNKKVLVFTSEGGEQKELAMKGMVE